MKPPKTFVSLLLMIAWSGTPLLLSAQSSYEKVYYAYHHNQVSSWKTAVEELRKDWYQRGKPQDHRLYQLIISEYGLIGACQNGGSCNDVAARIARVERYLQLLADESEFQGIAKALEGGLIALKINEAPWKGVTLAGESISKIKAGVELAPKEPEPWIELGNFRAHAPDLFGGDQGAAIKAYETAIKLYEERPEAERHTWLYLHALASLGQAYIADGQPYQGKAIYRKALRIEPNFHLVKNVLLPLANKGE